MKRILYLIALLLLTYINVFSQVPEKFNYQAVVRNSTGELIADQSVDVRITIFDKTVDGDILYEENHQKTTNDYGVVNLVIGDGTNKTGVFSDINWSGDIKFLKVEIDAGNGYSNLGTFQLLSVPYALYANSASNLGTDKVYSTTTDTLFVVKDHSGNVVFAVFPDGAQVYVSSAVKGKLGGFAVSGRGATKGDLNYLMVTPDSTRVYINEPVKGKLGGFAVSGRGATKGNLTDILQVTMDSTRIYTRDTISGFGIRDNSSGTSTSYMLLTPLNYFIGHNTGKNITSGKYNSMIGYEAGFNDSYGSNNLFLGYRSGYLNTNGGNNVFIGTESGYSNQNTYQSTYVGYRSGYELTGASNTVMGSMAGENAGGGNNTFIGTGAGRIATGGNNTFIGEGAGYGFPDENTGVRNTYVGQASGSKTTTGSYNVMLGFDAGYLNYAGAKNTFLGYDTGHNIHDGSGNVFIGYQAGLNINNISNRLVIENSSADSTTALIYGEFDQDDLRINGNVGINYQAYNNYGLIVNVPSGQTSVYTLYVYGSAYSSGGTWAGSDLRLKKDILEINDPIGIVKSIRGVGFNWRTDEFPKMQLSTKHQIGVIAQEVEKVLPELVSEDDQGYKSVAYDKLSAVLIEAIKEQQKQIEQLQNRVNELENLLLKK